MLRCFRNTQAQSPGARRWQQPQGRGSGGPSPARPAGAEAELPRPGAGGGPGRPAPNTALPALLVDAEPPQCRVWIRAEPRATDPGLGRAGPAPRRSEGRGRERAEEGRAGRSHRPKRGTAAPRSTGPAERCRREQLPPPAAAAAPRPGVAMGAGLALPAEENGGRGGRGAGPAPLHGLRCSCPRLSAPSGSPGLQPSRRNVTSTNCHLGTPQ